MVVDIHIPPFFAQFIVLPVGTGRNSIGPMTLSYRITQVYYLSLDEIKDKIGANWGQMCINQFKDFAIDGVREAFLAKPTNSKPITSIFLIIYSPYQPYTKMFNICRNFII